MIEKAEITSENTPKHVLESTLRKVETRSKTRVLRFTKHLVSNFPQKKKKKQKNHPNRNTKLGLHLNLNST